MNRKSEKDDHEELPIKEIIEIDGEVEISRDGEYLVIQSLDAKLQELVDRAK